MCIRDRFIILRIDEYGERVPFTIADFDREKGTVTIIVQIVGKTTKDLAQVEDCLLYTSNHLEEMAQRAQIETRKHFGNSVSMFTPLYIANYCENYCIYCGFNCYNKIRRAKLSEEEIEKEMQEIAKTGLQEILILTGESRKMSDVEYIGNACKIAKKYFKVVGVEVYRCV